MGRIKLVVTFAIAFAIAGSACFAVGRGCTEEARVSIVVSTVDSDGAPIADADLVVEWSDTGEENWVACETWDDTGVSSEWNCAGFENAGHFDIRAMLGERSGLTTGVLVREDECHVQTRNIDLVLQ